MAVVILSLALLFFLGHALSWLFGKTKIPDLLILIILGYLAGPILGLIKAEHFGEVGSVITTVALIVILYEGGLQTRWETLKAAGAKSLTLTLLTYFAAVAIGTICSMALGFKDPNTALIIGFAIGSTSSAIVIPMVRYLSVSDKTKALLSLESAFTDVLCIVLVLVMIDAFQAGAFSFGDIFVAVGPKTLFAILTGIALAFLGAFLKFRFPGLIPKAFSGEAWALFTYGLADVVGLNGGLAVLALGFTIGNLSLLPPALKAYVPASPMAENEMTTLSEISLILRVFFFLYLGLMVKFSNWNVVAIALIITGLLFVSRLFIARLLMRPPQATPIESMTVFAMGPRGLACAVVGSLPFQVGHPEGEWIRDIIFALIPLTILATAALVIIIEKESTRQWLAPLFKKGS